MFARPIRRFMKSGLSWGRARSGYQFVPHPAEQLPAGLEPRVHAPTTIPYQEREESGPSNIESKYDNVANGLPFEIPEIVNLNSAKARLLGDAQRIVELGSGTGTFAVCVAEDSRRQIVASKYDEPTRRRACEHRSRPNIQDVHGPVGSERGPFDVVVAVEVIEHVRDYSGFLRACSRLAPRALLTTPNRSRDTASYHCGPPVYFKQVREWTAGEFSWVLRSFYAQVDLYGMTSTSEPTLEPICIDDTRSALIADCREPWEQPGASRADAGGESRREAAT